MVRQVAAAADQSFVAQAKFSTLTNASASASPRPALSISTGVRTLAIAFACPQ